jgi:pimeloyl-ACP methyl ester carboxylesterase
MIPIGIVRGVTVPRAPEVDPALDSLFPAKNLHATFDSEGVTLHGVLYVPAGQGPFPAVVLLHGFPGWEQNGDIAHALRRQGFAVLVFHYRGCWGMPGTWSWGNTIADTEAVLDNILLTAQIAGAGIDPDRIAVVGHSLGGFLALRAAAPRAAIRVIASISGFDFGAVAAQLEREPARRRDYVEAFGSETDVLPGADGESLVTEMEQAGGRWSLQSFAPSFAGRPLLLVGGDRDRVAPVDLHHTPLVERFAGEPDGRLEHIVFASDHGYSDHRIALTRRVAQFLRNHL